MKFYRLLTLAFTLLSVDALASATTSKQLDTIKNSSGGSALSVPSTGSTLATDSNTLTFSGKSISGSTNTITNVSLTTGVTGVLPNSNTTAVSTNTNSAIVTRDGSGNFSAGTITAALAGNASTATNISGGLGGQVLYQSAASTTQALTNGTAGQMLIAQGTTLAPTWSAWTQEVLSTQCNGVATSFTLSTTPTESGSVLLYIDGALLQQGSGLDYTLSSATITLGSACATGQKLYAAYMH